MRFRESVAAVTVGFVTLFFSAAGYAQDKAESSEGITELYNAAKKEGRVVI